MLDNIGLPNGGINLAFGDSATLSIIRWRDSDLAQPEEGKRHCRISAQAACRSTSAFPDETFFFHAGEHHESDSHFGLPAPIDLQVVGREPTNNYRIAREICQKVQAIPGAVDVHIHQQVHYADDAGECRSRQGQQIGLTQRDVAKAC